MAPECPRHHVCNRPHGKREARQRPAQQREADPFDYFAQQIGTRHEIENTAAGNDVFVLVIPAQPPETIVRPDIQRATAYCQRNADNKSRIGRPIAGIIGDISHEPSPQAAIDYIKKYAGRAQHHSHLTIASWNNPRPYKRSMAVVRDPHSDHYIADKMMVRT